LLCAAASVATAGFGPAHAEQYPAKAIRLIVPTSTGTSTDAIARFFSEHLASRLNVAVVVENVGGAGGLLAYNALAKTAPDGYTVLLSGLPQYLLPLFSETPAQFDPVKDFTPITRVARTPLAYVVKADSPYKTLADLVHGMKDKPGELTYSSQGIGSTAALCGAILNEMTKTRATHVPYKQTSVAVTDVVGGHVTFSCQGSAGVLPLIQAGKMRALAVTSTTRWESLPDVPTAAQAGLQGLDIAPGISFIGPVNMPAPIVQRLSDEFMQIGQMPQYKEYVSKSAINHDLLDHRALARLVPEEVAFWKRAAASAH
jgi:tripartite-type tricarboxylate transporter receptor subunit TctC